MLLKIVAGVVRPTADRLLFSQWWRCWNWEADSIRNIPVGKHWPQAHSSGFLPGSREKDPIIIDFADIGPHVDEPIKHYSSAWSSGWGSAVHRA